MRGRCVEAPSLEHSGAIEGSRKSWSPNWGWGVATTQVALHSDGETPGGATMSP